MTRINAGIPVEELSDKHLLAEHREIKRIPNTILSGKAKIENIPEKFTLGKGHVKFFYDKQMFLYRRYVLIWHECIKRGFKVTSYAEAFYPFISALPYSTYGKLANDWEPTEEANQLIRQRIKERTKP